MDDVLDGKSFISNVGTKCFRLRLQSCSKKFFFQSCEKINAPVNVCWILSYLLGVKEILEKHDDLPEALDDLPKAVAEKDEKVSQLSSTVSACCDIHSNCFSSTFFQCLLWFKRTLDCQPCSTCSIWPPFHDFPLTNFMRSFTFWCHCWSNLNWLDGSLKTFVASTIRRNGSISL